jgi:hypothetical protein
MRRIAAHFLESPKSQSEDLGSHFAALRGMRNLGILGCLLLVASCSSKDPKAARTREEFCQEWANAACSANTVSACQATTVENCHTAQQDFCQTLVPSNFSDARADVCIKAVGDAYADADLTGAELNTVLHLGTPCDGIVVGAAGAGESCMNSRGCDGSAALVCVVKGGHLTGTCQIPEVVGAGLRCAAAQQVCAAGFYCDGNNCIQAKATGDACVNGVECGDMGFCAPDGVCAARFPVGMACTTNEECASSVCYTVSGTSTCVDRVRLSPSEPICADLR